jgi:hypothetical protein
MVRTGACVYYLIGTVNAKAIVNFSSVRVSLDHKNLGFNSLDRLIAIEQA